MLFNAILDTHSRTKDIAAASASLFTVRSHQRKHVFFLSGASVASVPSKLEVCVRVCVYVCMGLSYQMGRRKKRAFWRRHMFRCCAEFATEDTAVSTGRFLRLAVGSC